MRGAVKAIPLGALGFAVAVLIGCGGNDRLLAGADASSLQAALAAVQDGCAAGDPVRAERAAQSFSDRVAELSPADVDVRLIENLQKGAATLEDLAARTCTATSTPTTTVPTTPTTPTTTTTTPTTTLPTTTPTTTETTPTTPPETTPTTPPNGGGTPGNGNGPPGGSPPGQGGGAGGGAAPGAATP